jgi:BirA family transcriptional regulator, biotin operon repressor / biotin---[acetyl-CoA-carboxylase] ligase
LPQPSFTEPIGSPFVELQSVDSTNNYARQQIHAGLARHGMVIFAHEQTEGKGQRGRSWASEKGVNIIFSLLLKPRTLQLSHQFQLIACVAVAVQEFFMKYAGENTKIKWPNDMYWQDRKAGGVLIENIIRSRDSGAGSWEWAIIGIGININQTNFPDDLSNPVSLKQITGKDFNTVALAKELCQVFEKRYTELLENGFENIYNLYLTYLYKRKETVKLKKGNKIFEATIDSVSSTGKLIIEHMVKEELDFGEVEWEIR